MAEKLYDATFQVQWVEIDYPDHIGVITGSGVWIITLFVISMAFAFLVKPFLGVKI